MTTITITVFIICLLVFLILSYFVSWIIYKLFFKEKEVEDDDGDNNGFKSQLNTPTIFLILLVTELVIFSISAPFIFTRSSMSSDFNFMLTGQIGDTIGGLMSPFINLSAVIVTGLAFYMQYRANKLQISIFRGQLNQTQQQFKDEQERQDIDIQKQQFESQFYEMLRLHKENVNEIEIDAKKRSIINTAYETDINPDTGEPVPNSDGEIVAQQINYYEFTDYVITKRNAFVEMVKEIEYMIKKLKLSDTPELNNTTFKKIYEIFFWGLSGYETLANKFTDANSKKFEDILFNIQESQYSTSLWSFNDDIPFSIPAFRGHSDFLGHYYRHLFHTVKFVANYDEKILTKDEKKNYLRLLRAQLSNHEQTLLFYNWLSGYGGDWQNEKNNFLTEYRMIHNLWYRELLKETYFKKQLKKLVEIYNKLGYTDNLFELKDDDIKHS